MQNSSKEQSRAEPLMVFKVDHRAELKCAELTILDGMANQLVSTSSVQKAVRMRERCHGMKLKALLNF